MILCCWSMVLGAKDFSTRPVPSWETFERAMLDPPVNPGSGMYPQGFYGSEDLGKSLTTRLVSATLSTLARLPALTSPKCSHSSPHPRSAGFRQLFPPYPRGQDIARPPQDLALDAPLPGVVRGLLASRQLGVPGDAPEGIGLRGQGHPVGLRHRHLQLPDALLGEQS